MNTDNVVYKWDCSSYSGWGVVGLNLSLAWQGCAITASHWTAVLAESDPRRPLLEKRQAQSFALQERLARGGPPAKLATPVFVGLGNDLQDKLLPNGAWPVGTPQIAFPVVEDVPQVERFADRLKQYPLVVAASAWNRDLLGALGVPTVLCHQGFDPVLFNPSVRRHKPRADGRFRVFSGGKAEYRKGQDLVLEAFSMFAETHGDAVLVAAWSSPWPKLARGFDGKTRIGGPFAAADGAPDFAAWAQRYGIRPRQFVPVPPTPNYLMPELLAEIDVAVFPNRIEGGTNLVAMECMACGIPTILASGHGHDDLIASGSAIGFDPPVPRPFWRGWEAEPIVAALTEVYDGRANATPLGEMWAWPARIDELTTILRDV